MAAQSGCGAEEEELEYELGVRKPWEAKPIPDRGSLGAEVDVFGIRGSLASTALQDQAVSVGEPS